MLWGPGGGGLVETRQMADISQMILKNGEQKEDKTRETPKIDLQQNEEMKMIKMQQQKKPFFLCVFFLLQGEKKILRIDSPNLLLFCFPFFLLLLLYSVESGK